MKKVADPHARLDCRTWKWDRVPSTKARAEAQSWIEQVRQALQEKPHEVRRCSALLSTGFRGLLTGASDGDGNGLIWLANGTINEQHSDLVSLALAQQLECGIVHGLGVVLRATPIA